MKAIPNIMLFASVLLVFSGLSFSDSVTGCSVLDNQSASPYTLSNNLLGAISTPSGTACLLINASNIVVDCQGYNITNNNTANANGVYIRTANNVTVRNCFNVSGFNSSGYMGIYVFNSSNAVISNNGAYGNSWGFALIQSSGTLSDNLFQNNIACGNSLDGLLFSGGNLVRNNVTGNTFCNNRYGFYYTSSGSSTGSYIENNTAYRNTNRGFYFTGSCPDFTFIRNNATGNVNCGFEIDSCSRANLTSNYASLTTGAGRGEGFYFDASSISMASYYLFNNTAFNNSGTGIRIQSVSSGNSNMTFINNSAINNLGSGFSVANLNNKLYNNTAFNNSFHGIEIDYAGNQTLLDNIAQENKFYDLFVFPTITGDCDNIILNTTGSGGRPIYYLNSSVNLGNITVSEIQLCDADGANITNVTVLGSDTLRNNGFLLVYTDNATISGCNSSSNYAGFDFGFQSSLISTNDRFVGNFVFNNTYGFNLMGFGTSLSSNSNSNGLFNNSAISNGIGFRFSYAALNNVSGNLVQGNTYGIYINTSADNNTLSSNNISANSNTGLYVRSSNVTRMVGDRFFANTNDVIVDASGTAMSYNLSGVLFDNPLGSLANFTNLSIVDDMSSGERYSINWSSQPSSPPSPSFAGKFVAITTLAGSPTINALLISYLASEVTAQYDETSFDIFKYSGSTWTDMNATLNTSAHTLNLSNIGSFSVFGILNVTAPPPASNNLQIALNLPSDNAVFNTSTVDFNFTGTSTNATVFNCSLFTDGILRQTNSSVLNNTLTNFRLTSISDGRHNWSVSCNDNATWNSSIARNFTVDTAPPVVNLNQPADGALLGSGNVDLNFTATDNVAASFACSILLNGVYQTTNPSVLNNTPTVFSFIGLPDGRYSWSINCTDAAGNRGLSATRNFTIDTTPPVVTLNLPGNNALLNVSSVNLNFTATDNRALTMNCSLFLDGVFDQSNPSVPNNTLTNFNVPSISDGLHNWSVACNDSINAAASAVRNFTIQNTAPVITLNSPDDLAVIGSGNVDLNFTATDNVAASFACSILLNGVYQTTNPSVLNNTPTVFSFIGLPDGRYNWSINCTNTAGNRGDSVTRRFIIDTVPPLITLNLPGNNALLNVSSLNLNFTATDNRALTMNCSLYLDGALDQTNPGVVNNTLTNFNVPSIPDGLHNWSIRCNDTLNSATSAIRNFTIDTIPPVVALNLPSDGAVINTTSVNFNFTATDERAVQMSCGLFVDSTLRSTDSSVGNDTLTNFVLSGLANGNHSWFVTCNDGLNSNSSAERDFTLNVTYPPSTPSTGGGEESRPLSISFSSSCDGNVVDVTSSGKPESDVRVLVDDGKTQEIYYTDDAGAVSFDGCDGAVTVTASASGYKPKTLYSQALVACSSCGETVLHCQTDQVPSNGVCVPRCQADQVFLDGKCQPRCKETEVLQGGICVPVCKAPSCCKDDSVCADDYYCSNRDTGAAAGSCIPVTGCGAISSHKVSQVYSCGAPSCPSCPSGSVCIDHSCIYRDINGTGGFIGERAKVTAVEQGTHCPFCKVIVTDPKGRASNMTTDQNGDLSLLMDLEGTYRVTLLNRDGSPVKTISLQALPKPAVIPSKTPTLLDSLLPCWPWLLLLLLIIAGLIIYWRTRGGKGPKAGIPKFGPK